MLCARNRSTYRLYIWGFKPEKHSNMHFAYSVIERNNLPFNFRSHGGEGPPGPRDMGSKRLQQTQAQVDEVNLSSFPVFRSTDQFSSLKMTIFFQRSRCFTGRIKRASPTLNVLSGSEIMFYSYALMRY